LIEFAPPGQLKRYAPYLSLLRLLMSVFQLRAVTKKLDAAFAGREPLDEHTFYETYFQSRGVPSDVVATIRRILEEEFDLDLSRLSAEDDFARNLSFVVDYGSLDAVEVVIRLEEEFGIKITDAEAQHTTTVEGIVNLVCDKLRQRGA
jgi:acyl carrier protein